MAEDKKNVPMIRKNQKSIEDIAKIYLAVGQYQAFEFFGKMSQLQMARLLEDLHTDQKYREIPDCNTWEDVCDKFGLSRQQSYRLMDVLKTAGPELMELMIKARLSIRDQYQLLCGESNIEDTEFEVIDSEKGEIKIQGKKYSFKDNPQEIAQAFQKAQINLRLQRQAKKGLEANLEEEKAESKRLREKIKAGEAQLRELLEKSGKESVNLAHPAFVGLTQIIGIVNQISETEIDECTPAEIDRAMGILSNINGRLIEIFRPYWKPKNKSWDDDSEEEPGQAEATSK